MRTACCIAMVWVLGTIGADAVSRSDLSAAARALLPPTDIVTVKLKDNRMVEGEMATAPEGKVMIKVSEGTIAYKRLFDKSEIAEIVPMDLSSFLSKALRKYQVDPKDSLPLAECETGLALHNEFLEKWPGHKDEKTVRERRDQLAGELANLRNGMEKVDGKWMSAVKASVLRFRACSRRIVEMRKQYPGIEQPKSAADPKAVKTFQKIVEERFSALRDLPGLMRDRLPALLKQRKFEEAGAEMDAFVRFWVSHALKSESEYWDRGIFAESPFESMDFGVLMSMQRQILDAYLDAGNPPPPPPDVAASTNDGAMVYVPGGFFLMGREDAKPADPDFPMRLVYVKPFLLDRCEVSNAEYRKFLDHVKEKGDTSMEHPLCPPLKDHKPRGWDTPALAGDDQPVVGIDWFDAYAYAKWAGKRLPTEAEWELAARGYDARIYPWGETPPSQLVVNHVPGRQFLVGEWNRQRPLPAPKAQGGFFGCSLKKTPPPPPPTHTLPETTWNVDMVMAPQADADRVQCAGEVLGPFGTVHMAGNAAEWVNDWHDPLAYAKMEFVDPKGPAEGKVHVFRGGSYLTGEDREMSTFWRGEPKGDNMVKGLSLDGRPMIGLRCVRDLASTAVPAEPKKEP